MKKNWLVLTIVFTLSACGPVTYIPPITNNATVTPQVQVGKPDPTSTLAASNPLRGNVYLDSTELLTMESNPLQFTLVLKGNLPTPCNELHVESSPPDAENKIMVDVYSTVPTDTMCAEVLQPFEKNFPLGSFAAGHYTLWVNGQQIVEFDG
jgi:predicted small lipoprotein YifL